jgi:hypothetical protein
VKHALLIVLGFGVVAHAQEPAPEPPTAHTAEATAPPRAEPREAWELDAFLGYGQLAFPSPDPTLTSTIGGPGFALTVAYRGPHFTHPFFDLAYVPILSGSRQVNVFAPGGSTSTVTADSSSYALGFILGPGWDVDWFRFRAGLGLYDVVVHTTVNGASSSPASLKLGFLASASAMVWRPEPFAVGIEARLVALQLPTFGISQAMWELGVTGRWDFVRRP